jgi:hypothetical protein
VGNGALFVEEEASQLSDWFEQQLIRGKIHERIIME